MSETVTVTITEFLLARIAEDEDAAANASHHSQMMHDYERDNYGHLWVKTTRVLADCEAKRRIMELADEATGLDVQVDGEFRVGDRDEDSEPYVGDLILRALALPFADHEDYRPEWAP